MSKTKKTDILSKLTETDESVKEISETLNCPIHTIKWVAYENGISLKGRSGVPRKMNPELIERDKELCEIYLSNREIGISYKEIGDLYHIVEERVRQILNKQNIDAQTAIHARLHVRKNTCDRVVKFYVKRPHLKVSKLAKRFNMAHSKTRKMLLSKGIDPKETLDKAICEMALSNDIVIVALSKHFERSYNTISKILKYYGVREPIPKPRR